MEQLQNLYKLILAENSDVAVLDSEELLSKSTYIDSVKICLASLGYDVSKLSIKTLSALFFSLVDLVFVVAKDDSFYLATMDGNQVIKLREQQRVLPRTDDPSLIKASKVVYSQSVDLINKYLKEDKLHFIKLTTSPHLRFSSFFCYVTGMNPYPDLKDLRVFPMAEVVVKYNKLANVMLDGFYEVSLDDSKVVCTTSLRITNNLILNKTCTAGSVLGITQDNVLTEIPIWRVKGYERVLTNTTVNKLLTGVYKLTSENGKSCFITLNTECLTKYYGNFYRFESVKVRERYALKEMLSTGSTQDAYYYFKKYCLNDDAKLFKSVQVLNYFTLLGYLSSNVEYDKPDPNIIHARVLVNPSEISSGHKSYYRTLNISSNYTLEEVNIDDLVPSIYYYGGVSESCGFEEVEIKALSDGLADTLGKSAFEKRYGKLVRRVYIYSVKKNSFVKGTCRFKGLTDKMQRNLCQHLMWGYQVNFKSYSEDLRLICKSVGYNFNITDDMIKYLFVNQVAKDFKICGNITFSVESCHLINFLLMLDNGEEYVKNKLNFELKKMSKIKMLKMYASVRDLITKEYDMNEISIELDFKYSLSSKGYDLLTDWGILHISETPDKKLKVSSVCELMHYGEDLGTARLQ